MAASLTTYQLTPLYAGPVVGAEPVLVAVAGTVGPAGPAGEQGVAGPAGEGVPAGGATSTFLQKLSAADGDADWFDLFGSNNTWTGGQDFRIVSIQSPAAAQLPFAIIGFSGQTADLTQWYDNSPAVVASVSAAGVITAAGFAGPGSGLTGLNATQLTTGTVADARLSANVPLKDAANTFTVAQTFGDGIIVNGDVETTNVSATVTVQAGNFVGDGSDLTGLVPANVSAGVFVASQVFTSPFLVRQSGGVAGTDEIEVTHDGNTATLRNKSPGGIRYRNVANDLTTFQVTDSGRAVAVEFQGDGTLLTGLPEFDLLSDLTAAEIAITGATTATIGRMHVCSGTTADYTLTLPAVTGNTGKWLAVRMAPGLTRLVTLDAGAGVLIYGSGPTGSQTRVMHAGESAYLYCDGTDWHKKFGQTIPMRIKINRTTDFSVPSAVYAAVPLTALVSGRTEMHDAGNGRVTILRPSTYQTVVFFYSSAGTNAVGVAVNANSNNSDENNGYAPAAPSTGAAMVYTFADLAAGDYIAAWSFGLAGAGTLLGTSVGSRPTLDVVEMPTW